MALQDPEPQTRAERVRQTRARIVSVALTLFAEKGYEATSLQDIANEMGLTKPAVYYHYRGKQEILNDLAEPVRTALSALLDRARAQPLGPRRTEVLVTGLADLFLAARVRANNGSAERVPRGHAQRSRWTRDARYPHRGDVWP